MLSTSPEPVDAPHVAGVLEVGRMGEREAAAKTLGSLGVAASAYIPALSKALYDKEWPVRLAAADAVRGVVQALLTERAAQVRVGAAADALVPMLGDECVEVRVAAREALGVLGESAMQQVSAGLQSSCWMVRLGAGRLVAKLRESAMKRSAKAVRVALAELDHEDPSVRIAAFEALGLLGDAADPAVERLVEALEDYVAEVRCAAASAVGRLGGGSGQIGQQAREVAEKELLAADSTVRLAAARALGCLLADGAGSARLPRACDVALTDMGSDSAEVRAAAVETVGYLGAAVAPHVVEEASSLLSNQPPRVQCAAARALGMLGPAAEAYSREARQAAAIALDSDESAIRFAAVMALGSMQKALRSDEALLAKTCGIAARELSSASAVARVAAARAVASLGLVATAHLADAIRAAGDGLDSGERWVRLAAAGAVGCLGFALDAPVRAAVEVAGSDLRSEDWSVRAEAAEVLADLGPESSPHIEALSRALRDGRANVRQAAARALGRIGGDGVYRLAEAMRDVDWKARSSAAKVLQSMGYDAGQHVTINAMRDA